MKKKLNQNFLLRILLIVLLGIGLVFAIYHKYQANFAFWTRSEQKLNVPIENQLPDLPNGCEVTSLSMLLNCGGVNVTKTQLSSNIKHVSSYDGNLRGNPHIGFVGYMSIQNAGWCVYNEPLYNVARRYTNRIRNATGDSFEQVLGLTAQGKPVLIITTLNFAPVKNMQTWETRQGKVNVTPSSHACVITGYNKVKSVVYVNDPMGGYKNKAVNWKNIEASYNQQGKQALYLE